MRIEGRDHRGPWDVFDLGSCEFLRDVLMVDTDQAIYERVVKPIRVKYIDGDPYLPTRVHLARKIDVFPSCRLIVVFPWPYPQMERWAA